MAGKQNFLPPEQFKSLLGLFPDVDGLVVSVESPALSLLPDLLDSNSTFKLPDPLQLDIMIGGNKHRYEQDVFVFFEMHIAFPVMK